MSPSSAISTSPTQGATINGLKEEFGVEIDVPKDGSDPVWITITGDAASDCATKIKQMTENAKQYDLPEKEGGEKGGKKGGKGDKGGKGSKGDKGGTSDKGGKGSKGDKDGKGGKGGEKPGMAYSEGTIGYGASQESSKPQIRVQGKLKRKSASELEKELDNERMGRIAAEEQIRVLKEQLEAANKKAKLAAAASPAPPSPKGATVAAAPVSPRVRPMGI